MYRTWLTALFIVAFFAQAYAGTLPIAMPAPGTSGGGGVTGTSTLDTKDANHGLTFSNGNLTIANSGSSFENVRSTIARSGKICYEVTVSSTPGDGISFGIAGATASLNNFVGYDALAVGYTASTLAGSGTNQVTTADGNGPTITGMPSNGDVYDLCMDSANDDIWVRRNGGNWNGDATANPTTDTGGSGTKLQTSFSLPSGQAYKLPIYAIFGVTSNATSLTVNFGATAFTYSLPSGFSAWQ